MAADTTATHTTAGDYDKLIIQSADSGTTIQGSADGTNGSSDLLGSNGNNVPLIVDNYPFLLLDSDGTGDTAVVIAERVKDPS